MICSRLLILPRLIIGGACVVALLSGCEKDLKALIDDPIKKGMDREIENDLTTPEDREAVLKQSQKEQAERSVSLPRAKSERQPFKKGQFVTHFMEDEKGYKTNRLFRVYILDVVGDHVTFEVDIWDSDRKRGREPLFKAWAIEVSGFPKQIPLVLTKEWLELHRKNFVLHSYRELRPNGAIYKQQFDGSIAKGWNDWSADVLLTQYVLLYEGNGNSYESCNTAAITSTGCASFEGSAASVFKSDERHKIQMHSGVPITGVVSSEGSESKAKLTVVNFGMSKKSYIANLPLTNESEEQIRKEKNPDKIVKDAVDDVKAIWLLWQPGKPPSGDWELISPFIGFGSDIVFEYGAHLGYRFLRHGPFDLFNNSLSLEMEGSQGFYGKNDSRSSRIHLASDIRWDVHFHKLWSPYLGLGIEHNTDSKRHGADSESKTNAFAKVGSFFRIGQRFMIRVESASDTSNRIGITYTF